MQVLCQASAEWWLVRGTEAGLAQGLVPASHLQPQPAMYREDGMEWIDTEVSQDRRGRDDWDGECGTMRIHVVAVHRNVEL